ncbi:formin-like protein 5, partial [Homarus americanus]|uniref:formin-like protein 5 n=1 Tax=Homarus americanus TaxID=6706 RepID=UPI001C44447C
MTMDLMSSEAPLKMLSMSTGGLGKDTASLLEERTPTTPEGLWRAFLQGSHHHPPPTTQRLDALDRPLSPESPGPALVPPSGVGGRASPSPPPPLTSVCDTHGQCGIKHVSPSCTPRPVLAKGYCRHPCMP